MFAQIRSQWLQLENWGSFNLQHEYVLGKEWKLAKLTLHKNYNRSFKPTGLPRLKGLRNKHVQYTVVTQFAKVHPAKLTCPLKRDYCISVGNTSSNHWFSGDMLVFRGVPSPNKWLEAKVVTWILPVWVCQMIPSLPVGLSRMASPVLEGAGGFVFFTCPKKQKKKRFLSPVVRIQVTQKNSFNHGFLFSSFSQWSKGRLINPKSKPWSGKKNNPGSRIPLPNPNHSFDWIWNS